MSKPFPSSTVVMDNGDSFIPASQRPDGTWRKARRVKEGYVPQEEVPLYESKGKQFLNKTTKLDNVVLSTGQVARQPIPGLFIVDDIKEKKEAKKKKKKAIDEVAAKLQATTISEPKTNKKENCEPSTEKKIKNLKKKVREIEALETKLKDGLIDKPEPEQLQKVKRKNDLLMQIRELEKTL